MVMGTNIILICINRDAKKHDEKWKRAGPGNISGELIKYRTRNLTQMLTSLI